MEIDANNHINKILTDIKFDISRLDKKITEQGQAVKEYALSAIEQAMRENIIRGKKSTRPIIPKKEYKVAWRHALYFNAIDDKHAREIWNSIDTGDLEHEAEALSPETDMYNEFVEENSFECVGDSYRSVAINPE